MIDLRDFGLPESPQSREEQLCVNYGCEKRGRRKLLLWVMEWDFFGLWECGNNEFLLDIIIILKVGPFSYNILKFLFYMVSLF